MCVGSGCANWTRSSHYLIELSLWGSISPIAKRCVIPAHLPISPRLNEVTRNSTQFWAALGLSLAPAPPLFPTFSFFSDPQVPLWRRGGQTSGIWIANKFPAKIPHLGEVPLKGKLKLSPSPVPSPTPSSPHCSDLAPSPLPFSLLPQMIWIQAPTTFPLCDSGQVPSPY